MDCSGGEIGSLAALDNYAVVWSYVKKAQETEQVVDDKLWKKILRRYPSLIIYHSTPSDRLREIARKTMDKLNGYDY
jgi:hypothetical protein